VSLTPQEAAHAASITEPAIVEPIPPLKRPKVVIGAVVRKPPQVVAAWLKTLQWQKVRDPGIDISYRFIANFADEPYAAEVINMLRAVGHTQVIQAPPGDYGDGQHTRHWQGSSFDRLGALKNNLLQHLLDSGADYIWLVDADVLSDPYTLQSLLDDNAQVVSAVYWTNWQRPLPGSNDFVHAGPQVWLRHPYVLDNAEYTETDFRSALINRKRLQVGGLGANTLIARDAVAKGVSFAKLADVPQTGGMADGEDRHFCIRAQRLHVPLVADAWPDVWHAYHPADYAQIDARLAELENWPHPTQPSFGDLVSARIEPLEPLQDGYGRFHLLGAKYVRGKFGALPLLPELEESLGALRRGDSTIVRVHYPAHYEMPILRGATRLFKVTLLDVKAFRFAPTIDAELFMAGASRRFIDSTTLSLPQVHDMLTASQTA
jgi:hypothetical protein